MNPDWLLKHFEQISEAPDAVARLRRFILDLAVRGKLVEQNPDDELAAEVLKRIQANGDHGSNDGERKNQNLLPTIETGEIAFKIPENWVLTRVGKLLDIQYGKALPAADRSVQGSVAVYGSNGVVGYCEATLAQEPAIIIGRKGSAGALNLCDGPSWTTDVAYFLIPPAFFNIRFLFVALQTLDLARLGKGVKPGLNRSEAYQLPIVVPPLAEQHRIVGKVDELMTLCDELEVTQAKRERRRDRLVTATLHGLNNGDAIPETGTRPTFEESARFYFNHLPRLTTRPEHIRQLRQTILNLAVRGKLVPQDPKDEPASELLKRIQAKKQKLIRGRGGSKGRALVIIEDETPFEIPETWVWVQSTEPAALISDKGKKLQTKDVLESGEFPVVDQGKVFIRGYCNDAQKVIRVDGPIIVFGDHTRETKLIDFDFVVGADGVKLLKPIEIDPAYYFLALQWVPLDSRGYARHFKLLRASRFPLPPLAEQHRIVAKVEELMALCDKLEARITATATNRRQLLEATLQETLKQPLHEVSYEN